MITLEGGGGGLWEQAGGGRAWGWMAFLDAYYILFMFCVLVNLKKNYPCNKMSSKSSLKREGFTLVCSLGTIPLRPGKHRDQV